MTSETEETALDLGKELGDWLRHAIGCASYVPHDNGQYPDCDCGLVDTLAALSRAPGALADVFERPFDGDDDPRLRVARVLTRREAEAVLEHAGDLVAAPSPPSTGGEGEAEDPIYDALWDLVAAMANEGIPQTPRTKAAFKVAREACLTRLRHNWRNPSPEMGEISREELIEIVMRETTDLVTADGLPTGRPNILVQGCKYVRGHARGYEDPEAAAREFAGFIADAVLKENGLSREGLGGSSGAGSGAAGPSDCAEGDARLSDGGRV